MGEKEFQEIKERAEEVKILLGYGSRQSKILWKEVLGPVTLNLIENDVPRLVAEVEKLRAEQEPLRSNIPILKDEFSTRIAEEEERLRGIEASRAEMREVLEYVRGMLASLNIDESLSKIDTALSGSTVGHSDSRQAMNGNGVGDDIFQPSNVRSIAR